MTYQEMCIDAANTFVRMYASEYVNDEANFERMNAVIAEHRLDPSKVRDLIRAWTIVKAQAPATSASADGSERALTEAANAWITAQGGAVAARARIAAMSSEAYAREAMSAVFVRADEILSGVPAEKLTPAPTPGLGRGDVVREQGLREKQHTIITREAVEGVARSRREMNTSIYQTEEPPAVRDGSPHPHYFNPMAIQSVPGRTQYTKAELEANERANAARSGVPAKSRADAVREAQEREGKARAERWKK